MKLFFLLFLALFSLFNAFSQNGNKTYKVSPDLEIYQLSSKAYLHVSFSDFQGNRIGSNGLILVDGKEAFLFDTPMEEKVTRDLNKFINDSLKADIVGFVPNHWHSDCIGGLAFLHSIGVKSYANKLTIKIAKEHNLEVPKNGFTDSLKLKLGNEEIFCFFPRAAHSMDNIVVWIPQEKMLFAGCMAKEMRSNSMGNTVDGDLKAWPGTIKKVMEKFPSAQMVIPGHGFIGGPELLKHTLELAQAAGNK
jgi:metallo-beta-lactamase class B